VGGKSRSNTGIGIIDQAVDTVTNGASDLARHGESQISGLIGETGYAVNSGNWNNYLQTLGKYAPWLGSDAFKAANTNLETGSERKTREVAQQDAANAAADVVSAKNAQTRELTGTIAGIVNQRSRTPGRQQTLLTGMGGDSGTLLTNIKVGR
jgi:hypothetical protein